MIAVQGKVFKNNDNIIDRIFKYKNTRAGSGIFQIVILFDG